jgi:Domain of unknown function (DUF6538)
MGIKEPLEMRMPSPWKDPRTGMYYVRRKVPDRLKAFLPAPKTGKSWWKETLGQKDAKEAKRLFPEKWAECERDFELAEAKLASRSFKLTTKHAQSLAAEWLAKRIQKQRDIPTQLDIEEAQMDTRVSRRQWNVDRRVARVRTTSRECTSLHRC